MLSTVVQVFQSAFADNQACRWKSACSSGIPSLAIQHAAELMRFRFPCTSGARRLEHSKAATKNREALSQVNAAGEGAPTRAAVDACIHAALQRRSDLTKLLAEAGAARVRVPGLAAALDEASVARTPAPDQARILLLFQALTLNPTPRRLPPPHMIDEFLAGEARFCCVSAPQLVSFHSSHALHVSRDTRQVSFCNI